MSRARACVALDYGGTLAEPGPSPRGSDVTAVLRDKYGYSSPPGLAEAVDQVNAEARAAYGETGQPGSWMAVLAEAADRVQALIPSPGELAAAVQDAVPDGIIGPRSAAAVRRLHGAGHVLLLACNTRRSAESRRQTLAAAGLAGSFAALVLSSETGAAKPDPRFYAAVAAAARDHAGCGPESIVFAGDTPEKDIHGPARAGMRPVLVCPGPAPAGLPPGTPVVAHLAELPGLLERWP